MNILVSSLAVVVLAAFSSSAQAYEQATHAWLTREAIARLSGGLPATSPLSKVLGIDGFRPFGSVAKYFEQILVTGGAISVERNAQDYEINISGSFDVRSYPTHSRHGLFLAA